jgi:hypothetical protein
VWGSKTEFAPGLRPARGHSWASRVLEQRRSDLELLVTHRISLHGLPGVRDQLRAGRAIKVEVEPRV